MMQLIINLFTVLLAGVTSTSAENIIDANVRLNASHTGLVEVMLDGNWSYVCGDAWTCLEAVAVCTSLDFGVTELAYTDYIPRSNISVNATVKCPSPDHCIVTPLNASTTCSHLAGVVCSYSTTDCKLYQTNKEYRYRYNLPRLPKCATRFEFSVKASNDVHIALSAENENLTPMYEIVIGGWNNKKSVIRRCQQCENRTLYEKSLGFLNQNRYNQFWIRFVNGEIAVGYIGDRAFMTYKDPNPLDINYVGYSTGWGSTGNFEFCGIGGGNSMFTEDIIGELRLVESNATGLVEVQYDGNWSYICGDAWTYLEAVAVCRDLGFFAAEQEYVEDITGDITQSDMPEIYISEIAKLECEGSDNFLQHCNITPPNVSITCQHIAGVVCSNPTTDLRLEGGNGPHEGRVEVLINGTWGTICKDNWGFPDGWVVCRQFRYLYLDAYHDRFGEGRGPMLLTNMRCNRHNYRLLECSHTKLTFENCSAGTIATVVCSNEPIGGFRLNQNGSVNNISGIVEIEYKGIWGVVGTADNWNNWNEFGGEMVCKELGHPYSNHSSINLDLKLYKVMWLKWLRCYDWSDSFRTCYTSGMKNFTSCYNNPHKACTVAYVECGVSVHPISTTTTASKTTLESSTSKEAYVLLETSTGRNVSSSVAGITSSENTSTEKYISVSERDTPEYCNIPLLLRFNLYYSLHYSACCVWGFSHICWCHPLFAGLSFIPLAIVTRPIRYTCRPNPEISGDKFKLEINLPGTKARNETTDYSKAFDLIDHTIIVQIRIETIPWVCDFLTNRGQRITLKGCSLNGNQFHVVFHKSVCRLQQNIVNMERKIFQEILEDSFVATTDEYVGMALKVSSDNKSKHYFLHTEDGVVTFQLTDLPVGNDEMTVIVAMFVMSFNFTEDISNIKESLKERDDINNRVNTSYRFISNGLFSLSVFNMSGDNLNVDISVTFVLPTHKVTTMSNTKKEIICVYLADDGLWSDTGCVSRGNDTCYCSHTTSYAILMKTTSGKGEDVALSWISRTSIGISLIGLLATFITYSCFKKFRKSTRGIIHCNFTASIMLLQTVFIFGINKTENEYVCMAVTIGLHTAALSTFTWMLGEAVFIAFKVLRTTPSTYNNIKYYLLVCYSVPVVIVGLTLTIRTLEYRDPDICWLNSKYGLRWAFVFPAIVILLINCVILGMVVKCIYIRSEFNNSSIHDSSMKKSLKGALILIPLFGISWLIGPFFSVSFLMEYLFCIINGLQGFFIFLIYVVFDKEASLMWKNGIKTPNSISNATEAQTASGLVQTSHI
ncbi:uncharacterized protein LOC117110909 isoform X3 [Anneissia japonica]|uniref:uncharacterized protein LOC117110909 isoform X3 n=1 Tax=Anneissia japonica TaxID=1529436 RepID=UPI00142561DB|nr:uncharacterized protein LOC117110909 isoform X3 [Anneissia japonica]